MRLEICVAARIFVNEDFPEATEGIALDTSISNFEKMLEIELRLAYPTTSVEMRVCEACETHMYFNHEDIAATDLLVLKRECRFELIVTNPFSEKAPIRFISGKRGKPP